MPKSKAITILLLVFFQLLPIRAGAITKKIGSSKLPNGLIVEEYRLGNGMQLLFVPDHSAPVFTYEVWYKVGSASESLDPKLKRTGLAHLFEHMMFRGTKSVKDFDKRLAGAGAAENNANTWFDRTCYFESLPKERLDLVFQLESDRMVNLALDDKLFHDELGAVIGEYKMDNDKPMRVAMDELMGIAFTKHPYRFDTMGTLEELHSFKVEDAQYFYKTYYAPNDATLILIGDFSVPQALQLSEKYYGKYKAQEIPKREPPVEPEQVEARRKAITHPLANSEIMLIGYKIPNINHPDAAALEVASAVLSYGDSSLLENALVDKGLASQVSSSSYKLRYPALFVVESHAAFGKKADEILRVIHGEIGRIKDGKITAAELERAKNQFLLSSYNDLQTQTSIADNLGEALVSSDNYRRNFEILEEVKKVSLADLIRIAKTYFVDAHSDTIVLSPEKRL